MHNTSARRATWWGLWWRWVLASLIGAYFAMLLYDLLPDALTFPAGESFDFAAALWRYVPIYGVIYGATSVAQWWVLRQYVPNAWRWISGSVVSAALLFPASVWLFATIGVRGIAGQVWSAGIDLEYGIGGHIFAIVGQWLVLRRWTCYAWVWLLLTPLIGIATLIAVAFARLQVELWPGSDTYDFGSLFLYCWWFYSIAGLIIAVLLSTQRHPTVTSQAGAPSTAPGQ